jgi:prevent-host-death family protein
MDKTVSAADANRKFSKVLSAVRSGRTYVVTAHGKAVAKIVPVVRDDGVARAARAALLKRLRTEPVVRIGRWTRDELYEDKR